MFLKFNSELVRAARVSFILSVKCELYSRICKWVFIQLLCLCTHMGEYETLKANEVVHWQSITSTLEWKRWTEIELWSYKNHKVHHQVHKHDRKKRTNRQWGGNTDHMHGSHIRMWCGDFFYVWKVHVREHLERLSTSTTIDIFTITKKQSWRLYFPHKNTDDRRSWQLSTFKMAVCDTFPLFLALYFQANKRM